MKILPFLLFLFPVLLSAQEQIQPNIKEHICEKGKITYFQYNSDNTITIYINGISLYTTRQLSYPFIYEAFNKQLNVTVYTNSCEDGGGFAKIAFSPPGF